MAGTIDEARCTKHAEREPCPRCRDEEAAISRLEAGESFSERIERALSKSSPRPTNREMLEAAARIAQPSLAERFEALEQRLERVEQKLERLRRD